MAKKSDQEKIYLLDTNVLVHDPEALYGFGDARIGIPITVLQELDQFKKERSQRGRNARETIRILDMLRERGALAEGVQLDNGGSLQVLFLPERSKIPACLEISSPDDRILAVACALRDAGKEVHFISKDLNMRVKADALGLQTHDYLQDIVKQEHMYHGWINVMVPAAELKKKEPGILFELEQDYDFEPNEFVLLESKNNPFNYRVWRYLKKNTFLPVHQPDLRWPIQARNAQQLMALNLLLDDNVELVTLLGPAGTGKTFLALVAGLHKLLVEHAYEKMLVTRPVIPLGPDIGYLPGDMQEKLHGWMQPIYDNMDFIVHLARQGGAGEHVALEHEKKRRKGEKKKTKRHDAVPSLEELMKMKKIGLEAITYMRGRSIPYQYILIDEVQNLTPHEVKTLISRVGEGSKIILAGDPYQIDSVYLDALSNGLVVATQKFKGQKIFGTVFLEHSERSELSQLAGELL